MKPTQKRKLELGRPFNKIVKFFFIFQNDDLKIWTVQRLNELSLGSSSWQHFTGIEDARLCNSLQVEFLTSPVPLQVDDPPKFLLFNVRWWPSSQLWDGEGNN